LYRCAPETLRIRSEEQGRIAGFSIKCSDLVYLAKGAQLIKFSDLVYLAKGAQLIKFCAQRIAALDFAAWPDLRCRRGAV
jgi:hypothetical protein